MGIRGFDRWVSARGLAGAWLAALGACTAVQPECPREWLELGGGVVEADSASGIQDAWGWSAAGGFDLNADALVVSWELNGQWSQHDVDAGGGALPEELDVLRIGTGVRVSTRLVEAPLGAYVRGGWMWREEESSAASVTTRDATGTYFGVGLEWWYTSYASLGPSVTWWSTGERSRDEVFVGLSARFY